MKPEIFKTKKPKLILQVYHNYFLYHKDMKSYSDRKDITEWKKEINSRSGCFTNGKLLLSKSDYHSDILNCELIVLNDFNTDSECEALKRQDQRWQKDLIAYEEKPDGRICKSLKYIQYFHISGIKRKFEIFQLKKAEDQLELHLVYDMFEIGQPFRENFKLCNIEMDVPVEIKINGKLDHSLTSGRERSYKEHCYIFHLLGYTDEFELAREPFEGGIKYIPKPSKVVDLMKELY